MQLRFSFIIPVYNRPDEVQELLQSFEALHTATGFEIVIIEDGSNIVCQEVVAAYKSKLNISYFFKENSKLFRLRLIGVSVFFVSHLN